MLSKAVVVLTEAIRVCPENAGVLVELGAFVSTEADNESAETESAREEFTPVTLLPQADKIRAAAVIRVGNFCCMFNILG